MSDVVTPATKSPKKTAAKARAPVNHPKYSEMIKQSITALKERGGSSRQALVKYIMSHFNVGTDQKTVNNRMKLALRALVKNGTLKHSKGTGASGSFKLGAKEDLAAKVNKPKKPKAAAKPKSPTKVKKSKAKVPKTPKAAGKKTKKAKSPKKAGKSPAKKSAKPKAKTVAAAKKTKTAKARKGAGKKTTKK